MANKQRGNKRGADGKRMRTRKRNMRRSDEEMRRCRK
jgi:hypothetical protein